MLRLPDKFLVKVALLGRTIGLASTVAVLHAVVHPLHRALMIRDSLVGAKIYGAERSPPGAGPCELHIVLTPRWIHVFTISSPTHLPLSAHTLDHMQ